MYVYIYPYIYMTFNNTYLENMVIIQQVKYLLCTHEGLSLIPQNSHKNVRHHGIAHL